MAAYGGVLMHSDTSDGVLISAVIPTRNNAAQLRSAIESVAQQTLQGQEYEILIVDNGDNKEAIEVVQAADRAHANRHIGYVREPRVGLSIARNTGALAARGRWIAYMDDDAAAAPDWLQRIVESFRAYPGATAVGGKVLGSWEKPPPRWFTEHFGTCVSVVDWGDQARPLHYPEWVCGTNYAVEREVLLQMGGHDPTLGRRGRLRLGMEEVDLQLRIEKAGLLIMYSPQAVVRHRIPAQRLTKRYYLEQRFWGGRTQYLVDRKHETRRRRLGHSLWLLANTPRWLLQAPLLAALGKTSSQLVRLGNVCSAYGYHLQMLRGED